MRPFNAFEAGAGEEARVRVVSGVLSVQGLGGCGKEGVCSPTEEGRQEADGADSLAKGCSLLLAADSGRVVGAVVVEGTGSSGSTVEQGSGPGALDSSLSAGASGCTSTGEGDFGTIGSRLGVSSRRKSRELNPIKSI